MASSEPVKSSDAPGLEPSHPLAPRTETRFAVKKETESEGFAPRYLDLPGRHRSLHAGRRNLFWGVALLGAALLVLAVAVLIGGGRAMLWPTASLITFTLLWVLVRLRLFRQRNGIFFAVALVALVGSILALGERGFSLLAASRWTRDALPNVLMGTSSTPASAPELPLLTDALNLAPPDPAEGSRVKILSDTEVTIGRRNYRVRAGDTFPFEEASGGTVTFAAGEFLAKIPANAVQILGPQRMQPGAPLRTAARPARDELAAASTADPASIEIERRARAEAIRRFPALGVKNSPENREFLRTYNELKQKQSAMLEDPEWPIRLAEILAKDSGWREANDAETDPAPDAPPQAPQEP